MFFFSSLVWRTRFIFKRSTLSHWLHKLRCCLASGKSVLRPQFSFIDRKYRGEIKWWTHFFFIFPLCFNHCPNIVHAQWNDVPLYQFNLTIFHLPPQQPPYSNYMEKIYEFIFFVCSPAVCWCIVSLCRSSVKLFYLENLVWWTHHSSISISMDVLYLYIVYFSCGVENRVL